MSWRQYTKQEHNKISRVEPRKKKDMVIIGICANLTCSDDEVFCKVVSELAATGHFLWFFLRAARFAVSRRLVGGGDRCPLRRYAW